MSDEDLSDWPYMRLRDNKGVHGPVVGKGRDYISIEHETTVEVTRIPEAFEPCSPPAPREDALTRLDLTHEVVLNFLDEIVAGRFEGRERLLKGQAKLIAEGMRLNLDALKAPS